MSAYWDLFLEGYTTFIDHVNHFISFSLDGFVVCEEVADVLVAAWEEEKVEQEKKRKLVRTFCVLCSFTKIP